MAVPSAVVTVMTPVVPVAGAGTLSWVVVADWTVAVTPLNFTVLSVVVVLKFVPVIVTTAPMGPEDGLMPVMVGGVRTI